MHKFTADQVLSWVGHQVEDLEGRGVGRVEGVLVDRELGRIQWLLIRSGAVHAHHHAIPLDGITAGGGHLCTPQRKKTIERVTVPADGALSARSERELVDAYRTPPTRGSQLSRWERRATSARIMRDEVSGELVWAPTARGAGDGRDGVERRSHPDRSVEQAMETAPRPVPAMLLEADRRAREANRGHAGRQDGVVPPAPWPHVDPASA